MMMTAHDGRRYFCALPKPRGTGASDDETGGTGGRDATNASATDGDAEATVEDVLKPLEGRCFYRIEGWWTYEFCHMKKIRQYHQEDKKVTNEYNLGVYHPGLTKEAEKDRAAVDRSRTAGGRRRNGVRRAVPRARLHRGHAVRPHDAEAKDGGSIHVRAERGERHSQHRGAEHVFVRVRRANAGAVQAKRISREGEGDVARAVQGGAGGGRDGVGGGGGGVVRGESFAVPPKKTEL